jgi:hypothetical protein
LAATEHDCRWTFAAAGTRRDELTMFTRFETDDGVHVLRFDCSMRIHPEAPGAGFVRELGKAYEDKTECLRRGLLDMARDLHVVVTDPTTPHYSPNPEFAVELLEVIGFLESASDRRIRLYSYEKQPGIEEILDLHAQGGGASDWALEVVADRGQKACAALKTLLQRASTTSRHLSAIAILMLVFPGEETLEAVDQFINGCDEQNTKQQAVVLREAYRQSRDSLPR